MNATILYRPHNVAKHAPFRVSTRDLEHAIIVSTPVRKLVLRASRWVANRPMPCRPLSLSLTPRWTVMAAPKSGTSGYAR